MLLCFVVYLLKIISNMKILFPAILFILQLTYVCTTKRNDTSLIPLDDRMSGENELDNILNYSTESRGNDGPIKEIFGFFEFAITVVAIGSVLFIIAALGLVVAMLYFVVSSVSGSSSEGIILGRSFTRQLFDIGGNLINEKMLDDLTSIVDKSIQVVTKLYY